MEPPLEGHMEGQETAHMLKGETHIGYKGKLPCHVDGQKVEEVTQRGCTVSILGGLQDLTCNRKPNWENPKQHTLTSELTVF